MSQSSTDGETPEPDGDERSDTECDGSADDPDIEADLLQEELRIDGICGVY